MFGSHKNDDLGNSEDPQDNGGFISTPHPDPTGVPEPPAPGSFDPTAPSTDAPEAAEPETTAPVAPATDDSTTATETSDAPQFGQPFTPGSVLPAADTNEPTDTTTPTDSPEASTSDGTPVSDDLLEIKKEALQNLTPLVDHLDQTPEERFKTTMMMIQAADDQSLIQRAYDAANQITDESAKAQALLDIVNEINYFTQQHNQ